MGKYPLLDNFAHKRQCSEPLAKSHLITPLHVQVAAGCLCSLHTNDTF